LCSLVLQKPSRTSKSNRLSEVVDFEKNITVRGVLESKHSSAALLYLECLDTETDSSQIFHPIILEALDGTVKCAAAFRPNAFAGPGCLWLEAFAYNFEVCLH